MNSVGVDGWVSNPAVWSYGLAAFAFLGFALQLGARWRGRRESRMLFLAVVGSGVWCAATVGFAIGGGAALWLLSRVADAARYAALAAFMYYVLASRPTTDVQRPSRQRWIALVLAIAPFAALLVELMSVVGVSQRSPLVPRALTFGAWLGLAIAGLVAAEQIYRRTADTWRWAVRPLCLALICVFGFDLVLYSTASLFRGIDDSLWAARGVVHAFAIPLFGVAVARNKDWRFDVAVSRGVLVSTASLFLAGGYLVAVATVGYVLRFTGGTWAGALQVVLVSGALLVLMLVLLSGTFRSRVRVFIAKHFFSYRYDYRAEWLRLTQTLVGRGSEESLQQRCVRALADLVESSGGALWMLRPEQGYVQVASLSLPQPPEAIAADSSFIRFLSANGWIVDLVEAKAAPDKYPGLDLPAWLPAMPNAWLVVPLFVEDELTGFAVLTSARVRFELDWEVLDLLKTAGRGAASYLAQAQATEALLEARKFDAFNRMSAFVVHDLKNLVAQLQLLLRNVEKHGAKPEFQRDMLVTVEHVAGRMTHLMQQLRTGDTPVLGAQQVDLPALLERLRSRHASGNRLRVVTSEPVAVVAHEERLERVIGHLVQNAFDASPDGQVVEIRVYSEDQAVKVDVVDQGCGMTSDFIRDRLFKPFQTSKESGMGLGAYECQQYVKSLGGTLAVRSVPGSGTTVSIELRKAQRQGTRQAEVVS
jgi:putative PEP-CTERM system histidine kinase